MDERYALCTAFAAENHSVISTAQLESFGVTASLRRRWVERGLVRRVGGKAYVIVGSVDTWRRRLAIGLADLGEAAVVAGRSAAQLYGLDGFAGDHCEFLVRRTAKSRSTGGTVRSTTRSLTFRDIAVVDDLRCVRPERLILDGPIFGFSQSEIENAIDSAIRKRLVSEQRLRTRVVATHSQGVNGGRVLLDALVDSGGESRLERWLLRIVREVGLPRPTLQKVFRVGGRHVARVDALFGDRLIIEVEGHGTHSSRGQRQADEQRRTRLTLQGYVVLAFVYNDLRDRSEWVASCLFDALRLAA